MYCLFFQVPNGDLVIGAAVSLNTLINVLDNQAEKMSGYKVLADHVRKVITPIEILKCQLLRMTKLQPQRSEGFNFNEHSPFYTPKSPL